MTNQEKKKILLIDDDTSLLVTLRDFFSFEGYEVVTADSGEKGLERLQELTPDIIILDMSMPGMGGVGFLNEICSPEGKPRYPVLVLTARANMAEFFADVEVDGFVAKPCDPEDLLMEVGRIVFLRSGAPAGGDERGGARRSVLAAEDDSRNNRQLAEALEAAGFSVDTVTSGPEVLEQAVILKPDLVVVKRVLANMNGDTVARMLQEMPSTRGIPVLLYDDSGAGPDTAKATAPGTGVKRFVRSSDPEKLAAAAGEVLQT